MNSKPKKVQEYKIKRNVVAGLGEIGFPIFSLLSKYIPTSGFDINPDLAKQKKFNKYVSNQVSFLHICIPYNDKFVSNVHSLYKKFNPEVIVIHSTVSPYTTNTIQKTLPIPIIYSATRGIHKRMLSDLRRYTKFFAIEPNAPDEKSASKSYVMLLKKCGIKTKKLANPITLELAKILVDTSYYGWLINYAQITSNIAARHHVDYDEMWSFADEIHKFLGNRPKMFPGYIGGHCVIPNLDLIHNETLDLIKKLNQMYGNKHYNKA